MRNLTRFAVVLVLAALGWGVYWWIGAAATERGIAAWLDARRAEGWTAEVSALDTRGFVANPNGDFDANGVLDIIDFGYLADCQAGPNAAPSPANGSCTSMCLQAFDADNDGDIDLKDFASFTLQP